MSAAKAKRGQTAASKAAALAHADDSDGDDLADMERTRQRGMDFRSDEEDDTLPGGPPGSHSTARSMSGIAPAPTAQQLAEYAALEERDLAQRIRAHVMGSSVPIPHLPSLETHIALGGIEQYDDYSTQSADLDNSKLEDHEDDDMHAYLSVGASAGSGMPTHQQQQLHHHHQQQQQQHQQQRQPQAHQQQHHHQNSGHPQQQQQQQQMHPQQMAYQQQQQYGSHLQPHPGYAHGEGQAFSPSHMTLSPSPGAPFESGQYAGGGHLEGTW